MVHLGWKIINLAEAWTVRGVVVDMEATEDGKGRVSLDIIIFIVYYI